MLFNNLYVVRFPETVDFQDILIKMSDNLFQECSRADTEILGWESPLPNGDLIVNSQGDLVSNDGCFLVKLRTDTKKIPVGYLKLKCTEAIDSFKQKNGYKASKSEKEDTKETVLADLVAKAFPVPEFTFGYVDLKNHWLVINTGTAEKAEAFISFLRQTMGSLPVAPLLGKEVDVSKVLTNWVKNPDLWPGQVQVTDKKCVVQNPDSEDKSKTTFDQQDMFSHGVESVLASAGKRVTQLSIEWDERFTSVLDKSFIFKGVRATDLNTSWQPSNIHGDLAIMQNEFESMIGGLVKIFTEGGEND